MATLRKYGGKYNSTFCQLCGLSTDTKPTSVLINDRSVGLADGSEFIEMDTNKKYRYSADNATWYEVESGGGGGGSATLIDKTITANRTYNATDDGADGYSKVVVDVQPSSLFYIGRSEGEWPLGSNSRAFLYYTVDTGFREISISRNAVTGSTLLRNLTYVITDSPTKKFTTYTYGPGLTIYFTPSDDFAGFYNIDDNSEIVPSGDTVTPGDGKCYSYEIMGNGERVVTKYDYDFSFEVIPSSN